MSSYHLGLIGAGNMAEAIVRGALSAKLLTAADVTVSDPSPARRELFAKELGVTALESNAAVVERSHVVILAVKPQMMDAVLAAVGPQLTPPKLVVSIAAGVTLARLGRACPAGAKLIRTMPNTPMLVGRGMVALCRGPGVSDAEAARVRELFASCAEVIELPESQIDAVTAVSGSGPAYFFLLVEALTEAGVAVGLSAEQSRTLAVATFAGAAELLSRSDVGAAELRRRVTSPGGTTEAAIKSFTADGFQAMVTRAVAAAAQRSRELGK